MDEPWWTRIAWLGLLFFSQKMCGTSRLLKFTGRFVGEVHKPWTPASWHWLSQQLRCKLLPSSGWINGWHRLSLHLVILEGDFLSFLLLLACPMHSPGLTKKSRHSSLLVTRIFSHFFIAHLSKLRKRPRTPGTFWTQGSYWVCILPSEVPGASTLVYCLSESFSQLELSCGKAISI